MRVSEALYIASGSPPHLRGMWSTTTPLRFHKLIEELLSQGANQIDASDAITDADRAWLAERQLKIQEGTLGKPGTDA
jgi:hypothetical protein